jgi:hypothetical protein
MLKRLYVGALALMLALGGGAAQIQAAPTSTAPAVAAAAPLATLQLPMTARAAELSSLQMTVVQGDGIFSSIWKWAKKTFYKVVGVIIKSIFEALSQWVTQQLGLDGGEEKQKTDTHNKNYASQADYDAGIEQSSYTEEGTWQQTSVWYGSPSGCDGGREGTYQQVEMIRDDSGTCY